MAATTHASPGEHARSMSPLDALRRALAVALLPLSILPVVLFGRALLRAPEKLWREAQAEVRHLQEPRHVPEIKRRGTR
jgi:hypothetical protein